MSSRPSRRDIVKATVGGMIGLSGCAATRVEKQATGRPDIPGWIDAHVHVWTDDVSHYPLAPGFTKSQLQPPTFTPEELFAHCEPCGVRRINLIQMSYYGCDNRYMLDVMEQYPGRFAGTAIVDLTARDVGDQMRRLKSHGVRAFRIYPGLVKRPPAEWLRPDGCDEMFKVGAESDLAMSCLIDPDALPELDRMCRRYPDTPVIIDHLCRIGISGQIDQSQVDALCRMSRHKRVMVKVGAFYALGRKKPPYHDLLPLIRQVVGAFGPQRCMWETDCPFQIVHGTYEASLALIRDRCDFLSRSDREQILRKTAETFFFPNG
ncbi:MAG: amidohydrolase family protein [Phycisphaerae bacterium]|nr:amidohydrolase family protein [Phycisphaerae bacterium]